MADHNKHSLFVTFEGGEGTGKTTVIEKLEGALKDHHYDVIKTREPGGSKLGEYIRHLVLYLSNEIEICHQAELQLFLAARVQHIHERIVPALKNGKIVLCDRFNDSTIAYQGHARGLGMETVQKQCELACHGIQPNLTIYLDLDPRIGLERTKNTHKERTATGQIDRIELEKLDFHTRVREGMQLLAKQNPKRIFVIDASQSPEKVFEQAFNAIQDRIKGR